MKSLIWKLRYAVYFYRRIGGDCWKDWRLAWDAACISWDASDGPEYHPHDSAEEELSEWRN